jgi:hypothetical protein
VWTHAVVLINNVLYRLLRSHGNVFCYQNQSTLTLQNASSYRALITHWQLMWRHSKRPESSSTTLHFHLTAAITLLRINYTITTPKKFFIKFPVQCWMQLISFENKNWILKSFLCIIHLFISITENICLPAKLHRISSPWKYQHI